MSAGRQRSLQVTGRPATKPRHLLTVLLACVLAIVAVVVLLAVVLDRPASGHQLAPDATLPITCNTAGGCVLVEQVPHVAVRS